MRVALVLAAAAFAISAPLAGATSSAYSAMGTYAAGAPRAVAADACADPANQGLSSDCAGIPAAYVGASYILRASSAGSAVVNLSACFYSVAGALIRCDATDLPQAPPPTSPKISPTLVGIVPAGATNVAVGSDAGLKVMWSLRAG